MDHRCRSGKQCVSRTSEGSAITVRADTLCPGCVAHIQKCLDSLPTLSWALRKFLGGSTKTALESRVKASREPAAPMNVHVADLLDEIGDVVDRTDHLSARNLIQQPAQLFLLWVKDVQQKVYLDGVQRALDVRRVYDRVQDIIGFERQWQRRGAPCPECNLPTLGNWVGSEQIICNNTECGSSFTLDQYEDLYVKKAEL